MRKIGSLDEWLSQRSAKPCTAVRIRQEPLNKQNALSRNTRGICCLLTFSNLAPLPFGWKIVQV